jgi:hypothetical protein
MIRRFAVTIGFALVLTAGGTAQASDDFVKKADKICAAVNKKVAAITAQVPDTDNPNPPPAYMKRVAKVWAQLPPILKREMQQLDALGQPSSSAARTAYKRWHTIVLTVSLKSLEDAVRGARTGSGAAFTAPLSKAEKYNAELRELRNTIGFKACGGGG